MTRLRKMMLEELQRLNYSQHTTRYYIRTVEDFARRFRCSPDRLGPRHIREYQAELFQKRKLSPGTVAIRLAALRFFYTKTLKKPWSIAETPYPKRHRRLPVVLSQEEVARLIDAASNPFLYVSMLFAPDAVDLALNCKLVEAGKRQAEEQADPPLKDHECLSKCPFNLLRCAFDSGWIRHSPMRGHGLSRPDRAGFSCGVVAVGKDKVHFYSAGLGEFLPALATRSGGGQTGGFELL